MRLDPYTCPCPCPYAYPVPDSPTIEEHVYVYVYGHGHGHGHAYVSQVGPYLPSRAFDARSNDGKTARPAPPARARKDGLIVHRMQKLLAGALGCALALWSPERARSEDGRARAVTLADVARLAKDQAPSVRAAEREAKVLAKQRDVAVAGYLPTLSAEGQFGPGRQWSDSESGGVRGPRLRGAGLFTTAGVRAAWTVFNFGGRRANIERAEAEHAAVKHGATEVRFATLRSAAESYLRLVTIGHLRENAALSVERREAILSAMQRLIEAGVRPRVDLQRAQIDAVAVRSELSVLDARAETEAASLAATVGLDPTTPLAILEPDEALLAVETSESESLALAEARRPELAAQRERVRAAESSIGVVRARRLPHVQLYASGDLQRRDLTRGAELQTSDLVVQGGVAASWQLVDVGVARTQQAARAAREAEAATLAVRSLEARTAAVVGRRELARAERALEQAEQVLSASRVAREAQHRRYQSGEASLIELLDAEGTEQEARSRTIEVKLEVALARIALLDALGLLEERLTGGTAARQSSRAPSPAEAPRDAGLPRRLSSSS